MKKVLSADGTPIAYESCGDGQPIILVGGAFNNRNSPAAGMPLARLLATDFMAIAYDRRGRGDSGDTEPYSVEREIEDLQALIAEVGSPVLLYGHSSGAILALLATIRGLPIAKLLLFEPPLKLTAEQTASTRDLAARITRLIAEGRRTDAATAFMIEAVGMPTEVVSGIQRAPFWSGLESIAHTLPYDLAVTTSVDLADSAMLPVGAPTLVMEGDQSPASLRQPVKEAAERIPGARLRTLEGKAHDADPESIASVMREWLLA